MVLCDKALTSIYVSSRATVIVLLNTSGYFEHIWVKLILHCFWSVTRMRRERHHRIFALLYCGIAASSDRQPLLPPVARGVASASNRVV